MGTSRVLRSLQEKQFYLGDKVVSGATSRVTAWGRLVGTGQCISGSRAPQHPCMACGFLSCMQGLRCLPIYGQSLPWTLAVMSTKIKTTGKRGKHITAYNFIPNQGGIKLCSECSNIVININYMSRSTPRLREFS